ncbi:MAG: CSLREA domain-containing protein [Pseudomonadota bacterium]
MKLVNLLLLGLAVIGLDLAAAELRVNTVADTDDGVCESAPGDCSLRDAITAANAPGPDQIRFDDLPGSGPWTIEVSTQLPTLTDNDTVIDGSTAPGSGDSPLVAILGSATVTSGLRVLASNSIIRNLAFLGFSTQVLIPDRNAVDNHLSGNWFGLAPDGITTVGAVVQAVSTLGSGTVVGTDGDGVDDEAEGNLIVGTLTGVFVNALVGQGLETDGVVIAGNRFGSDSAPLVFGAVLNASNVTNARIGTNGDGISDGDEVNVFAFGSGEAVTTLGFDTWIAGNRVGIDIDGTVLDWPATAIRIDRGTGHVVGGDLPIQYNWIDRSQETVISIAGANTQARVERNKISNAAVGAIRLGAQARRVPDPLDMDQGPNGLQNYPVLNDPARRTPTVFEFSGTLEAAPATPYRLTAYLATSCLEDGEGELAVPLGVADLGEASVGGSLDFALQFPVTREFGDLPWLAVTVTDMAAGATSEASNCVYVDDGIFQDAFE